MNRWTPLKSRISSLKEQRHGLTTFVPFWSSIFLGLYFAVSATCTIVLYGAKNEEKYRDVVLLNLVDQCVSRADRVCHELLRTLIRLSKSVQVSIV